MLNLKIKPKFTEIEAKQCADTLQDGIYIQIIEGIENNSPCNSVYLWFCKNKYFHELSFDGRIITAAFQSPEEFLTTHAGMLVDRDDNKLIYHKSHYRVQYLSKADIVSTKTLYSNLKDAKAMYLMLRMLKSEIVVDTTNVLGSLRRIQQHKQF